MLAKLSLVLVIPLCLGTSGCYLAHVAVGQAKLLRARHSIEDWLSDSSITSLERERLALVRDVRAYAADLGLDVGEQYTSYVPWPGDRVVTGVVATRPGELVPAGFSFPFLGALPYKGYFDPERAEAEEARLRRKGLDVCRTGVRAYSTLGWFADPVTGPMLRMEEGQLVETLVHELVHATVYLRGEAGFNEGVASFIGEEASVRFYRERGLEELARTRRAAVEDWRRLDAALLASRDAIADLYAGEPEGAARESARRALEVEARSAVRALSLATLDAPVLAERVRLNDACLALLGTYANDTPRYAARLAALGDDLRVFVSALGDAEKAADPRATMLGQTAPDASGRADSD